MFERLKSLLKKQSRSGGVIFSGTRQAQWMRRRYKEFAEEGYRRNVVAYMAINKVSRAAAAIPLTLFRGNKEIVDHPLLRLLQRPNPMQSGSEYMQALVGFFLISGNAYIERTMVNGVPRELYTLRPDRMKVVPGPMGLPRGYTYTVGQDSVSWDSDPMTGESDIRHLRAFNPLDDWYGMSPIEAGAFAVDQHNESMQWMQALLQNGAAPSGALEYTKEGQLGDDEYARLKAEIDEQYSGSRNAGRPLLLEGGMTWRQMGFSPDQMAALESRYASARDIALAFGVSPLLLNIPGDSTYSNYREARLALYEETVLPLMDSVCDELNAWLAPAFGDRLRIGMDVDSIPAIAEKRREMWAMADRSQDLTINERREIKGYEAISGGDEVLVPANLLPLGEPLDVPSGPDEIDSALGPGDLKAIAYGDGK